MQPKRILVLLIAPLAVALAACGEKHDTVNPPTGSAQSLSLMLDYVPNADHVGIYRALAENDFQQAGLDVHVQVPSDPAEPLKLVAAGRADVAISYEPELMLARDKGLPLVSIAALVQRPLTSIVSLRSARIRKVGDLAGKTVGDAWIPYQHAYLQTILQHAGVDPAKVHEVNVGFNLVPAMLSHRVDATLGAFWNYEAIQLAQLGKHPNVLHMEQVGVPNYDELILVARASTIATHGDELRRFVQALARGYESARSDPTAAVGDLLSASPGLNQKLQLASVRATLPAFFPPAGRPWGWQDQGQWNSYGEWMLSHGLIHNSSGVVDASTNELLAGQGV